MGMPPCYVMRRAMPGPGRIRASDREFRDSWWLGVAPSRTPAARRMRLVARQPSWPGCRQELSSGRMVALGEGTVQWARRVPCGAPSQEGATADLGSVGVPGRGGAASPSGSQGQPDLRTGPSQPAEAVPVGSSAGDPGTRPGGPARHVGPAGGAYLRRAENQNAHP